MTGIETDPAREARELCWQDLLLAKKNLKRQLRPGRAKHPAKIALNDFAFAVRTEIRRRCGK